jgi:hypothetical protein
VAAGGLPPPDLGIRSAIQADPIFDFFVGCFFGVVASLGLALSFGHL